MRGMRPAELRRRLYWASDRWPERLSLRSTAFMRRSNVEVGSFGSFSYVSSSLSKLSILLSYWTLSRTTVQLPLSAGTMASDMSDFICLRAFVSSGFKLLAGGLAFANTPTMRVLALFLASWGACDLKMVFSTAATN